MEIKDIFPHFLLLMKLDNWVQLPNDSVIQYWMDIEFVHACLDNNMPEKKCCAYNLEGLNPALLQQRAMLETT